MAFKVACVLLAIAMVCNGYPYYYGEDGGKGGNRGHGYGQQGSQRLEDFGTGSQGQAELVNQGPGFGTKGGQGSQGFPQGYQGPGFGSQSGQGSQHYEQGGHGGHRKGYQEYGY